MIKIGITERGDAGTDFSWMKKHKDYDGIILITKNLSDDFIEKAFEVNSIVHATITGYGGSILEPNVHTWKWSANQFSKLVDTLGKDRVILRIDPIIPNDSLAAFLVYNELIKFGTRVRISFLDNYPHVKKRFKDAGLKPLYYYFHAPIESRKKIASYFQGSEICGEPGFDCTGCISEKDLKY